MLSVLVRRSDLQPEQGCSGPKSTSSGRVREMRRRHSSSVSRPPAGWILRVHADSRVVVVTWSHALHLNVLSTLDSNRGLRVARKRAKSAASSCSAPVNVSLSPRRASIRASRPTAARTAQKAARTSGSSGSNVSTRPKSGSKTALM